MLCDRILGLSLWFSLPQNKFAYIYTVVLFILNQYFCVTADGRSFPATPRKLLSLKALMLLQIIHNIVLKNLASGVVFLRIHTVHSQHDVVKSPPPPLPTVCFKIPPIYVMTHP